MKIYKFNLAFLLFLGMILIFSCKEEEPEPKDNNTDTTDTTDTNDDENLPPPTEHPIQIRTVDGEAEFYNQNTNETFVPVGVNYYYIVEVPDVGLEDRIFGLNNFDAARIKSDFETLKSFGYNVVRIFIDHCSEGPECIGIKDGEGLNTEYLKDVVETMQMAKETGIYLHFTSNDLPAQGGYWPMVDEAVDENFGPYRNAHYLTNKGVAAGVKYWNDLMRELVDLNAPFESIFCWSLLNEQWYLREDPPFSLTSGEVTTANGKTYNMAVTAEKRDMAVDGMIHYIDTLSQTIRKYDPKSLITMGFFMPESTNPINGSHYRYHETAPLLGRTSLDFFDFHAYPNPNDGPDMETLVQNYGLEGFSEKPILMGEVGAFTHLFVDINEATEGVHNWIAQSCQYGFDGWLYWGLYRPPEAIGDATYCFMDENQEVMKSLAPINTPDLCDSTLLPAENYALNKPTSASNELADNPSSNAVDGDVHTNWSAGADPPQWIEIDLESTYTIDRIKLHVDQHTGGTTNHNVLVKGETGDYSEAHVFNGHTEHGEVLDVTFDPALTDIRYVKVETTTSPSWVGWLDIEVLGK